MPVVENRPPVTASPHSWVAASNSPHVRPASARAVFASGLTSIVFIGDRSITMPASHVAYPTAECPPPRTETSRSFSRAKFTAATTSAVPAHCAISAGLRSNRPFQTFLASS